MILPYLILSAVAGEGLSKSAINATITKHRAEVRECYQAGLKRDPALKGKVVTAFTLAPNGKVDSVEVVQSELPDAAVGACLTDRFKTWQFPESLEGDKTAVKAYPFLFNGGK